MDNLNQIYFIDEITLTYPNNPSPVGGEPAAEGTVLSAQWHQFRAKVHESP